MASDRQGYPRVRKILKSALVKFFVTSSIMFRVGNKTITFISYAKAIIRNGGEKPLIQLNNCKTPLLLEWIGTPQGRLFIEFMVKLEDYGAWLTRVEDSKLSAVRS